MLTQVLVLSGEGTSSLREQDDDNIKNVPPKAELPIDKYMSVI